MPQYEMPAEQYRGEGSEAAWRITVKEIARAYGWVVLFELPDKAYSVLARLSHGNKGMIPVMQAIKGQPDLLLGHPERGVTIAVELKVPGKKPMPHQREKLDLYGASGTPSYVWETGSAEADDVLAGYGLGSWG